MTGISASGIVGKGVTVNNRGTISSSRNIGIFATATATVSNWGSISATEGIYAGSSVTLSNWGSITGSSGGSSGYGIDTIGTATVSNWGSITAMGNRTWGIYADTVNVSNWGSITATGIRAWGINAVGTANITNWGTISGTARSPGIYGYGIDAGSTADVTNGGTIYGNYAALYFEGSGDTLTLLPGSTIIGAIHLGSNDTVNFRTGNQNLTLDPSTGPTITSTVPYVVSGNQVATIDPTPFAMANANLMDFTRSVASVLDGRSDDIGTAASGSASPLAFAPESDPEATVANDFAAIPGLTAYADPPPLLFKAPTVRYSDGTTVWGRGFAGQRVQQTDGNVLATVNQFYGGMIGSDRAAGTHLRLGGFVGAGETRSSEELNMGDQHSDLVFGGLFGRYDWDTSFLDLALQGGHSRTSSTRHINNNLAPGGVETANASYNGWYVSPQASYGRHYGLGTWAGASYMLTPSANVRYLYASLGSYTESGSTADLTVNSQTVSDFEERGQLEIARTVASAPGDAIVASLYGGVLGDQHSGTIDAALLGQAIPFATPGKSAVWGGYGGGGLQIRNGPTSIIASAQYLALSDDSSVVSGRGGMNVAF